MSVLEEVFSLLEAIMSIRGVILEIIFPVMDRRYIRLAAEVSGSRLFGGRFAQRVQWAHKTATRIWRCLAACLPLHLAGVRGPRRCAVLS